MAVFASMPRHDAGGVAILLQGLSQCEADKAPEEGRIRHSVIVPGCVQRLQLRARASCSNGTRRQDSMMVIYNIHNFGLGEATAHTLMRRIAAGAEIAAGSPHRSTVILMGDFNFHEKAAMYIATPEIDK
eukprot:7593369-Pyramimonas_sp.AAC.1